MDYGVNLALGEEETNFTRSSLIRTDRNYYTSINNAVVLKVPFAKKTLFRIVGIYLRAFRNQSCVRVIFFGEEDQGMLY